MIRFDSLFLRWLLFIGAVAALIADALLYPFEQLVIAQRDAGNLHTTVALGLVGLLAVILTAIAIYAVGEHAIAGIAVACVATAIAYLIGETHLAALSLGVSVATFGDRHHSVREPRSQARGSAAKPSVSRAQAGPDEPRSANDRVAQQVELHAALVLAGPHVGQRAAQLGVPEQRRQVVEGDDHPTWFTGLFVAARIARSASEPPRNSQMSPVAAVPTASSRLIVASVTGRNLRSHADPLEARGPCRPRRGGGHGRRRGPQPPRRARLRPG